MALAEVVQTLRSHQCFLITTHVNPEGDALGSELALGRLIHLLGKRALIVNQDPVPFRYLFLPGAASIQTLKEFRKKKLRRKPEAVFVLDCPLLGRTGRVSSLPGEDTLIVNIDHHPRNAHFGTVNWVDTGASSVGEMIYRLFRRSRLEPDRRAALFMYVAILTDTGSFSFRNTDFQTHRIAAELLKHNLDPEKISRRIYHQYSYGEMKLLGRALSGLKKAAGGRIVWTKLTPSMFLSIGAGKNETEHFIGYLRSIRGVEVALLFHVSGEKKEVKVSLRSNGKVDVSRVAHSFGGGGHRAASGCTVKGGINEVERKVIRKVRQALHERT